MITPKMQQLEHLSQISVVRWPHIPPGSVILSGLTVNGAMPPELADFPTLTEPIVDELTRRYQLNAGRKLVVATPTTRLRGVHLAKELRTLKRQLESLRQLVGDFHTERQKLLQELEASSGGAFDGHLWESPFTERARLVKDQYNSFTVSLGRGALVPTLLDSIWTGLTLGEVLAGTLRDRRFLPDDPALTVHLVLDCSNSMKLHEKSTIAVQAINRLADAIGELFVNADVRRYVFSDTAKRVSGAITGREVSRRETSYAAAFKRVLHFRAPGRNKLFLVTDGEPTDLPQALRMADLIAKHKVDYTQILLHSDGELNDSRRVPDGSVVAIDGVIEGELPAGAQPLTAAEIARLREERFDRFTRVAEHAGGNQVVLTLYRALRLVSLELYDRYVGLLTLAQRESA